MDFILTLTELNILFEEKINENNEYLVYSEGYNQLTYKEHISTKCITTAAAIRWLLSNDKWVIVDNPTYEIYQVSIYGINDDLSEDNDPAHCFIVYNNDLYQQIYQSYYGKYSIRKSTVVDINILLINPKLNWYKLTGNYDFPNFELKVIYKQPTNWKGFNLSEIKQKVAFLQS
jgi:hypothetical protein